MICINKLLEGYRGTKGGDNGAAFNTVVRVPRFAWSFRNVIAELDINPLLVGAESSGAVAVDALIVKRVTAWGIWDAESGREGTEKRACRSS